MIGVKLFLCVTFLVALTSAYPAVDESDINLQLQDVGVDGVTAIEALDDESKNRVQRVTCDLLSWGGTVNDSACAAAHCILKGYSGGWCDGKKICNCR